MGATLVIQTSFLGDVVLTTPLLSALADAGPVDVVTTPAGAALLRNHPAVRAIIPYDKRKSQKGLSGMCAMARILASAGYERACLAQGSWRSAALAWLARIPRRVGFTTSAGRTLYTTRIAHQRSRHHAERLWMLAELPSAASIPPIALYPGADDVAAVDTLLGAESRPLIALAPGSVWATKRWPGFPALVAQLPSTHRVVVIGGAEDRALAASLVAAAPDRVLDGTGKLGLLASAELVRRASTIVTNDSLPQHLASAMGTPTVAIFGPTVPALGFGPRAPRARVIEHAGGLDCRPCGEHGSTGCPRAHFRCMREISADQVREAVFSVNAS
jgi:heptosyltransferase II